ncbi:CBS domain-containing protein [Candidatus Nitrosotalea bavarica]|uniref:CBS domain-containing protein n=1 Tax=Candidatus Nitrosotalea bavarica TaxID=1903277 RepID=UPI000C708636|nr:CBS domain-containing protein [Candidatus Nitrosotalea bavarica]
MSESIVKEIMAEFVQTIHANSSVLEATQIMTKLGIGSLVVTQGGQPVGVLTERDIVTKVASQDLKPSQVLVEKIMSHPIISVEPEMIIVEAATLMSAYNIRRLVVVGKDDKLVGIVTATDIASWLARNEDYKNNALNAIARLHDVQQCILYQ